MEVAWSKQARESLATIYDYIAGDSPDKAERVVQKLFEKAASLRDERVEYPKDPIINKDKYRFILQWNFKIIYERTDKKVIIIDIFHTHQDPTKMKY